MQTKWAVVKKFKEETFHAAHAKSLPVNNESGEKIAELVPIGSWALNDDKLIEAFCNWRKVFMRFFLGQFESSISNTYRYLDKIAIRGVDRILFALYCNDILIGHLGLCNITDDSAEADNIIRGKSGGDKDLMLLSELTLVRWAFEYLSLEKITTRIMSKNILSQALFLKIGFKVKKRYPLYKVIHEKRITYEQCTRAKATENFTSDLLEISKSEFENGSGRNFLKGNKSKCHDFQGSDLST